MQGGSVVFLKESVIKNTPNIPLKNPRARMFLSGIEKIDTFFGRFPCPVSLISTIIL
jgi:hypothetical protein